MSLSPTSNVWTRLRERVGLVLETDSTFQSLKTQFLYSMGLSWFIWLIHLSFYFIFNFFYDSVSPKLVDTIQLKSHFDVVMPKLKLLAPRPSSRSRSYDFPFIIFRDIWMSSGLPQSTALEVGHKSVKFRPLADIFPGPIWVWVPSVFLLAT